MLDIKLLREESEKVKKDLKRRPGFDVKVVDEVIKADSKWRDQKGELDTLKAQRNKESKAIAELKKKGEDVKAQIAKVGKIADEIKKKEADVEKLEEKRNEILLTIPNILDPEVPSGDDEEGNVEIRQHLKAPKFDFKPKGHIEICEQNDWINLKTAAKHSGARFYYMKGELVMLEQALFFYVLEKLTKKGYVTFSVPPMLRRESAVRAIPLGDFEDTVYSLKSDEEHELFLIGTSEHTLAVLHADEVLNHKDLPKKYCGVSQCFRRELGVTKDTKGIFRVHNFNKIEQFIYCKPQESDKFFEELMANAEEIFQDLELHYSLIEICSGDMGVFAARKQDIEVWLPSQEKFREVVSGSNYRDFGARRLGVRYQSEKNEIEPVHSLNCTAVTNTRPIIAILEQYQTKDGNVRIPKVLRPYLGGREFLKE